VRKKHCILSTKHPGHTIDNVANHIRIMELDMLYKELDQGRSLYFELKT